MFSITLCDRDSSSTVRAVSFKPTKTYNMKGFKVKKGFGGYSSLCGGGFKG